MISKEKVRNQVKSRFYYLFWGIATFSVVAGQLYVGSGYRMFARSLNRKFDTVLSIVDRKEGAVDLMQVYGIKLKSLYTIDDFN